MSENLNSEEQKNDLPADDATLNEQQITEDNLPMGDEATMNKLLDELNESKDKYLRLFAEFDNFKKRTAKENLELIQTAGKNVIFSLLEVLDDCKRAESIMENTEDLEQIKEGINLVFHKFRKNLEDKGVKVMEAKGADFNVDLHEAITEIPAPSEDLKGKVLDVVQNGYYLNDKLIRFAKVVVGN